MKFYNTFKRNNGNYVTQEWSGDDVFTYDILQFCFLTIFGSLLSVISSTICLFVRLYDYEEDQKAPSIFGVIFSLYFVLDYCFGWPITFILKLFESQTIINNMFAWNVGMLLTHIVLLIFGDTIYYNTKKDRKAILTIAIIFVFIISYFISLCLL